MRFASIAVMVGLLLLFSAAGAMASEETRYTWGYLLSDVPNGVITAPSMGVDDDGNIWVAYYEGSGYEHNINVTWYDGSTWHQDNVDKVNFNVGTDADGLHPVVLKVINNVPHIFYCYNTSGTDVESGMIHAYYDQGAWQKETVWSGSLLGGNGIIRGQMSVDYYGGIFYITFSTIQEGSSFNLNAAFILTGNTGSWNTPVKFWEKDAYHFANTQVWAHNGTHIGVLLFEEYINTGSGDKTYYVNYTVYDGSGFSAIEEATLTTDPYMPALVLNETGAPYIYLGKPITGGNMIQEVYKDLGVGIWKASIVDQGTTYYADGPVHASLAPNGTIVVAYNKPGQSGIHLAFRTDGGWNYDELDDPLSGNALFHMPWISFDSSGNVYVAYVNYNSEKADNQYIVVATTNSAVPEFGGFIFILAPMLVAIFALRRIS